MSKFMKKVFSIAMAAVLVITCFVPAFAKAGSCTCGNNPILIITGFSEFDLVDHDTGKKAWMPETDAILSAVEALLPALTEYIASDKTEADSSAFCDVLIPAANALLDPVACSPNGDVKHENVGLVTQFYESVAEYGIDAVMATEVCDKDIVKSACNAVGPDHVWVYGLDWRVDPMVIADEINTFVQHMKAETGHDKVSISGISMGGVAMAAYLAKYGTDDISNITMMSSAFTGLEMVGQLFTGNIAVDEQGLYNIINDSIGDSTLSDILSKTGIVEKIIPVIDELLITQRDRIFMECLVPNFGYNAGLWSFVPDSYFKAAKVFMNERMNYGTTQELTQFWGRVNDYHNNVQCKIGDILKTAKQDGVCVAIVSNYNLQMPPATPASIYTGDQVIETMHTSGYATVALHGKTLGDAYPRNAYLSEDRMVDASTCMLPDNTWFIKNMQHVGFSETGSNDNGALYAWLLTAKEQYDIHTNVKFPQFMVYNKDAKLLTRLSNVEGDVSGDMKVSIADAKLALQEIVSPTTFTSSQIWAADRDYSGDLSVVDVKLTLMQLAAQQ